MSSLDQWVTIHETNYKILKIWYETVKKIFNVYLSSIGSGDNSQPISIDRYIEFCNKAKTSENL